MVPYLAPHDLAATKYSDLYLPTPHMALITDFISGRQVKETAEEREAVQPISRILVEDLRYPKTHIQTRPQHRVKVRPSDTRKGYPVDVCVFRSDRKTDDNEYIIVECKQESRSDGLRQLKTYLRMSTAELGLLYNGRDSVALRKIESAGRIEFHELPGLPVYGQRVEDIGRFRKRDLRPTHNLKSTFSAIRNHLAGTNVGATRDEELAKQIINLIFCKLYDEKNASANDIMQFRAGVDENANSVAARIRALFENVKDKYADVLSNNDTIDLPDNSVAYVVGELQLYALMDTDRDSIADAFEVFIGGALKGAQGQFFTPRNVVRMMVSFANPSERDMIIDPACGSGGFLVESLRSIWRSLEERGRRNHWGERNLLEEQMAVALRQIHGIDKDAFLAQVSKTYMAILGDGKGSIMTDDSLEQPELWQEHTKHFVCLGKYDWVLTNPPFGKGITVTGESKLGQYDLAHKWALTKNGGGGRFPKENCERHGRHNYCSLNDVSNCSSLAADWASLCRSRTFTDRAIAT